MTLDTVQGQTLSVSTDGYTIRINGQPVIAGNLVANNGVVHAVSGVLIPTFTEEDTSAPATDRAVELPSTVVAVAADNPDFSILVEAVTAANLAGALSGDGPFTVLTVAVDTDGTIRINGAAVVTADMQAENGVVHVIDAVLTPPSEKEDVQLPATVVE
eukprot:scaffold442970_cov44-Prasinocladus_malaysianus.AAC.1